MKRMLNIVLGSMLVFNVCNANIVTGIKDMLVDKKNEVVNLVTGKISDEDLEKSGNAMTKKFMDGPIYTHGAKEYSGSEVMDLIIEAIALDQVMENGIDTMTFPMDITERGTMPEAMFNDIIGTLSGLRNMRVVKLDTGKYLIEEFKVGGGSDSSDAMNYIVDQGRVFEWSYSNMLDRNADHGWDTAKGLGVMGAMFTEISNIYNFSGFKEMPVEKQMRYVNNIFISPDNKEVGWLFVSRGPVSITIPLNIKYSFGGYEISYDVNMNDLSFNYGDDSFRIGPVLRNTLWFKTQILKTSGEPMVSKSYRQKYFYASPANNYDYQATKVGIDFNNQL